MPPMSMPVPIPTAPPSSISTDARVPDPDDIWKGNLRKRIHLVEDVQTSRDTTLGTHLSNNNRSRVQRDYQGSMNEIRALAEEEFTRQSYSETSEFKWILDVDNSTLLDVVRKQPWILDKADEERTPFVPPNTSQNDDGIFSTSPHQLVVSGQGSDGRYRSTGAVHEGGEPDGSKGSAEAGEGEGDTKPRQPHSNVSLTRPLHSKSQISRENSPLYRRHTSFSQLVEDNDDEERDDPQPYSPGQVPRSPSPGSQAPAWLSIPIAPEHSGRSYTFADKNGEIYSTSPVSSSRLGSINTTGSLRSGAGLRYAGSLDPNQDHGSSFAHSDTEHLPVHNHYPIVSNIAPGPRRDSVPLPSPQGTRQGMVEAERIEVGARHTEASAKMRHAAAQKKVAEAKRNEAEAKKRETEAQDKVEEARQRELEARQKEEMAKRNEEAARQREEEARRKEEDARRREDDARRRLEDARQREMLAQQREEEARRFEEKVRKEDEARRKEDAARRRKEKDELRTVTKEEERKPRPAQEKATRHALGSSRHERNEVAREADDTAQIEATKVDAANRSAEVESAAPQHKNQSSSQVRAQTKWQRDSALEERHRKQLEEQHRLKEQRYLEEKRREEERHQREREEQVRLDEELSRQARLDREDLAKRERLQEEQILLDEKLGRLEQARLDHEAFVEQEWKREEQVRLDEELSREEKEREANRLRKDQQRLAEEERYRVLKEQHRKVRERGHQRDQVPQQQQSQHKETLGQRANDEEKEFRQKVAEHYRRTTEREHRNNIGAAFGTSVPHRLAGPTPPGNRAGVLSKPNPTLTNTRQRVPVPYTSAPKSEEEEWVKVGGNRVDPSGTKKGASLAGPKLEEEELVRRTEERAKQQPEQFESEQLKRVESERQAKNLNAKFVPKKRSTGGARATGRSGNTKTATNLAGIIPRGLFQQFRR